MSFGQQVLEFEVKVAERSDSVLQGLIQEVFNRINARTPVDTGQLRNSWNSGPDPNPVGIDFSAKFGQTWYIINRMPYAPVVEFGLYPNPPKGGAGKTINGFSRQAPAGMVRVTLAELAEVLRGAVDNARK